MFAELVEVGGALEMTGNPILDLGNGSFPVLASIGGPLTLQRNGLVGTLGAFASLDTVEGPITIKDNAKLATITAASFGMLTSSGSVSVTGNPKLANLPAFTSHQAVEGAVDISSNPEFEPATNLFPVLERLGSLRLVGSQEESSLHVRKPRGRFRIGWVFGKNGLQPQTHEPLYFGTLWQWLLLPTAGHTLTPLFVAVF